MNVRNILHNTVKPHNTIMSLNNFMSISMLLLTIDIHIHMSSYNTYIGINLKKMDVPQQYIYINIYMMT